MAQEFMKGFDKKYWGDILSEKKDGKYMLDLWRANEIVLLESGIKQENIQVTDICTHCNSDFFYFPTGRPGMREGIWRHF